jgi:predicted lipid-binding transport protein (Tim44 family)
MLRALLSTQCDSWEVIGLYGSAVEPIMNLMSVVAWVGTATALIMLVIGVIAFVVQLRRRRLRQRLVPRYASAGRGLDTMSGLAFESFVVPGPSAPLRADATMPPQLIRGFSQAARQLQLPSGFDLDAFVTSAKRSFMQWRAAWLEGDQAMLRQFTASDMFERVRAQLEARASAPDDQPQAGREDVVALEAELLALHQEAATPVAAVRFKGLLKSLDADRPHPFDEVWNLAQVVDEARWVVSNVEPVHSVN